MLLLPLHLPRRHRRPLLFPPGLLALAWLLWLGCVAVPRLSGDTSVVVATIAPLPLENGLYTNRSAPSLASAPVKYAPLVLSSSPVWYSFFFSKQLQALLPVNPVEQPLKGLKIQLNFDAAIDDLDAIVSELVRQPELHFWLDTRMLPTNIYVYRVPFECAGSTSVE